eukprot:gb/GECG01011922.1/.p1 GENE.gb/GECG01011922.1/~~gb/GECG01011922.1/.p1  ORF type:complete len:448 (+),score=51.85 gb/GECG01011922.1/:1-1344(+)
MIATPQFHESMGSPSFSANGQNGSSRPKFSFVEEDPISLRLRMGTVFKQDAIHSSGIKRPNNNPTRKYTYPSYVGEILSSFHPVHAGQQSEENSSAQHRQQGITPSPWSYYASNAQQQPHHGMMMPAYSYGPPTSFSSGGFAPNPSPPELHTGGCVSASPHFTMSPKEYESFGKRPPVGGRIKSTGGALQTPSTSAYDYSMQLPMPKQRAGTKRSSRDATRKGYVTNDAEYNLAYEQRMRALEATRDLKGQTVSVDWNSGSTFKHVRRAHPEIYPLNQLTKGPGTAKPMTSRKTKSKPSSAKKAKTVPTEDQLSTTMEPQTSSPPFTEPSSMDERRHQQDTTTGGQAKTSSNQSVAQTSAGASSSPQHSSSMRTTVIDTATATRAPLSNRPYIDDDADSKQDDLEGIQECDESPAVTSVPMSSATLTSPNEVAEITSAAAILTGRLE